MRHGTSRCREKGSGYQEPPVLEYKVVECSTVTDEELEKIINDCIRQGWQLDGIHFAMRESSKRPAMAFVLCTRQARESNRAGGGG
jgi:hypothetical protein